MRFEFTSRGSHPRRHRRNPTPYKFEELRHTLVGSWLELNEIVEIDGHYARQHVPFATAINVSNIQTPPNILSERLSLLSREEQNN